jgi:VanZ family protein
MRPLALALNLALLVLVFYLGTVPSGPDVDSLPGKDKLGHALAFGALAAAQFWALQAFRWGAPRVRPWSGGLLSTLTGGVLELVQTQLPSRSAELLDLVADAVGAFVVAACIATFVGGVSLRRGERS